MVCTSAMNADHGDPQFLVGAAAGCVFGRGRTDDSRGNNRGGGQQGVFQKASSAQGSHDLSPLIRLRYPDKNKYPTFSPDLLSSTGFMDGG